MSRPATPRREPRWTACARRTTHGSTVSRRPRARSRIRPSGGSSTRWRKPHGSRAIALATTERSSPNALELHVVVFDARDPGLGRRAFSDIHREKSGARHGTLEPHERRVGLLDHQVDLRALHAIAEA